MWLIARQTTGGVQGNQSAINQAYAESGTNLLRDIKTWHTGDAPPAQLLKFPDGKMTPSPDCDMRVAGSQVGDYISQIQNADLLAALLFDNQAQPETIRAAAAQLITVKGIRHVFLLFAEKRKTDPNAFKRSELAILLQLLRSPYVPIHVARIASKDMTVDKAESALLAMKADLLNGTSWADAYRKHADLHPDMRIHAGNPKSNPTLIGYLFQGTVSPSGFDIINQHIAESLPPDHLRELFHAKHGVFVFRATDGVYLYHIQDYQDDAA